MRRQRRRIPQVAAAAVVSVLMACAPKPPELRTYEPPPASVRGQLGAVAVVPVKCDAVYDVSTPAQGGGAGAAAGAEQGAAWGAAPGALLCSGGGGFGCIVGLPAALAGGLVGAIGGSVAGAGRAHSAEDSAAAETVLRQIMTKTPADEILADLIVTKARETRVSARVERADKGTTTDELAKKGFSSSLLIEVVDFTLVTSGEIEPRASFHLGVYASIQKTGETDRWCRMWRYRSAYEPFFDLAANDGSRLREDINTGLTALATKVVADVFVTNSPESYPSVPSDKMPAGVALPFLSCQ